MNGDIPLDSESIKAHRRSHASGIVRKRQKSSGELECSSCPNFRRFDKRFAATMSVEAELEAALLREADLLRERADLLKRQELLTQEFEHRLVNGLQMISSLLSLQSRTAPTPEAASQLMTAANRVAAFGRVHRRLHFLDHRDSVEFKPYIQQLCDDLAGLLFESGIGRTVVLAGPNFSLPTTIAIPLGFILNELITNAMKYAQGDVAVRTDRSATTYSLSVSDDGPGLPANFDPAGSKGLGMRIVQALVGQIGGTLRFVAVGGGTCATVCFSAPSVVERTDRQLADASGHG